MNRLIIVKTIIKRFMITILYTRAIVTACTRVCMVRGVQLSSSLFLNHPLAIFILQHQFSIGITNCNRSFFNQLRFYTGALTCAFAMISPSR